MQSTTSRVLITSVCHTRIHEIVACGKFGVDWNRISRGGSENAVVPKQILLVLVQLCQW